MSSKAYKYVSPLLPISASATRTLLKFKASDKINILLVFTGNYANTYIYHLGLNTSASDLFFKKISGMGYSGSTPKLYKKSDDFVVTNQPRYGSFSCLVFSGNLSDVQFVSPDTVDLSEYNLVPES